jgi:predicted XRE-type DNA-binding protein
VADEALDPMDTGEQLMSEALMTELVKLRKRRKIGQGPIAEAIGMTQSRVSQMENLKRNVNLETVLIYAKAIGCKVVIQPENETKKKG